MLLDGKRLDEITEADLLELRDNKEPEGKGLDYKQELPGPKDSDKREFLADVSSFANAGGGFLIYGVEEDRDSKGQPAGTPAELRGLDCVNQDTEGRRLDSIIRSGIEPRTPGIGMRWVPVQGDRSVLVIHVRRSWSPPHRVTVQGHGHFYSRTVAGKYQLDVDELRAAFVGAEAQAKRLRDFRDGRLARIIAGETPVPLVDSARLVLHLVPLFGERRLDLIAVMQDDQVRRIIAEETSVHRRLRNFDGVVGYGRVPPVNPQDIQLGYVQVFRNGAIEAVDVVPYAPGPRNAGYSYINGHSLVRLTVEALTRYLAIQESHGVSLPIVVMLSLLHVQGLVVSMNNNTMQLVELGELQRIKERDLILPDVLMEDWAENPASVLRPLFDMLWNACGYPSCGPLDSQGQSQDEPG